MAEFYDIRRYRDGDIPVMVSLVQSFLSEDEKYKKWGVDVEEMARILRMNAGNSLFHCNVVEFRGSIIGGLCATTNRMYFNPSILLAIDMLFYLEPAHRSLEVAKLLIEGYKEWGRARKVHRLMFAATTMIDMEKYGALLTKHGFGELGRVWSLDL